MRRIIRRIIALTLVVPWLLGAPANAQYDLSTDWNAAHLSERKIPKAERAHQTMNDYAVCLVTSHHGAVRKALARKSDAEVAAALAKVSVSDCLAEGRLIMPPQLLRGALYRALYLRDFGKRPPSASASGPMHEDNPLRLFGHCVYAIDPVDVRAFVMADPATALEKEAIAALGPALAQCVSPGSQIRFSPAVLQAILAEAAYRGAQESSGIQ